ncbi:hypothetical protein H4J02_11310 [Protaetiibacter sp. SSC-01]|uniref:hypothetical protein n=1 Tax=Protaetiibacter sp. SSC-01 TaxID=2759943 RepID=UPI001656ADFD|nr:hypothetical protein [Protaetiibacter sp. SSC-01]QNO37041.1 hypothetical protein H4J02_11310 [Protaetiibacter sp. SSC-01]
MTDARAGRILRGTVVGLAVAYLATLLIASVARALAMATGFDGFGVDGPFQLYNPLRRLAEGGVPGVDVPFFHGVGVLALHFPLFALLGENIFASEMSRWLVSPIVFLGTGLIAMRIVLRRWLPAIVGLAVYTMIVLPLDRMVDPSNSLLGIRTTLPVLAAALLAATPRRGWRLGSISIDLPVVGAIIALGFAVSFGTEQGAAACGAFLVIRAIMLLRARARWRTLLQLFVEAVALVVAIVGASALLTGGHPLEALRYALVDIPGDQGWVFGAPPNVSLTWDALLWELRGGPTFQLTAVPVYWMLALAALVAVVVARRLRALRSRAMWAASMMGLYGLAVLASITGYLNLIDQMSPLARVAGFWLGASLVAIGWRLPALVRVGAPRRWATAGIAGVAALALVASTVGSATRAMRDASAVDTTQLAGATTASDDELLGERWRERADAFLPLIPDDATVWSEYSGLIDSIRGDLTPAPGGEDYAIHALGERRGPYEDAFLEVRPDFVVTSRSGYNLFSEWLWSRWPRMYGELFRSYTPVAESDAYVLWERGTAAETHALGSVLSDGAIRLPRNDSDEVVVYRVTVTYDAQLTRLPLASRLPRYLLEPAGTSLVFPISLQPGLGETWAFLVPVLPGAEEPSLAPRTSGIVPSARLTITSAVAEQISIPTETQRFFVDSLCDNMLTDVETTPACR